MIKSPFNYIGNKYRIIEDIQRFFPKNIHTMVDLFCGGCDVVVNTHAEVKYANDINYHVIEILQAFQQNTIEDILQHIDDTIEAWGLTKDDEPAYLRFREYVNREGDILDLYTLMNFSFNYQFRFNSRQEYNNTFGRNRSSFNSAIRTNLMDFNKELPGIHFSSIDFVNFDYSVLQEADFLYADPPYSLTCGSYNDGKRGFRSWT
ncbi:MAG: DNA adenine methylase, partial [Bacilli bacterium]